MAAPAQTGSSAQGTLKVISRWTRETHALAGPCGIAVAHDGTILVTEEQAHRLTKRSPDGQVLVSVGQRGHAPGEFMYPTACAIDAHGYWYVTDRWNHRVQQFDAAGTFVRAWGSYGSDDGCLNEPWGIACVPHDEIVVVDHGNARLCVFDREGRFLRAMGHFGAPAAFYSSARFKGNIHYDTWMQQVSRLNPVERHFFLAGYDVGELEYPEDVTIDAHGHLVCADRAAGQVTVFDLRGELMCILDRDTVPGFPAAPHAVTTAGQQIVIADEQACVLVALDHTGTQAVRYDTASIDAIPTALAADSVRCQLFIADVWHNSIVVVRLENGSTV